MRTPVLLIVLVALAGVAGQGAAPAEAVSVSGFAVVQGLSFEGSLDAVSAHTASDVWAVGGTASSTLPIQSIPYAEHWDGHRWRSFPVPMPGGGATSAYFSSISAVSATDVWAAGWAYHPDSIGGFVEHWNGARWSWVSKPDGVDVLALSAHNVWVSGTPTGAPEHWNGSTWTSVTPPTVNGKPLLGLGTMTGKPDDVWFSGEGADTSNRYPVMVHWDGSRWTVFQQPIADGFDRAVVQGLSMSATGRVYGVGFTDLMGGNIFQLYGRIYDDGGWSDAPLTQFPTVFHELWGVAATGDGQAWAVGQRGWSYRTLIEHWDEASHRWIDMGGPNPCSISDNLVGVAAVGGTQTAAYAVGACVDSVGVEHPLILHHS